MLFVWFEENPLHFHGEFVALKSFVCDRFHWISHTFYTKISSLVEPNVAKFRSEEGLVVILKLWILLIWAMSCFYRLSSFEVFYCEISLVFQLFIYLILVLFGCWISLIPYNLLGRERVREMLSYLSLYTHAHTHTHIYYLPICGESGDFWFNFQLKRMMRVKLEAITFILVNEFLHHTKMVVILIQTVYWFVIIIFF